MGSSTHRIASMLEALSAACVGNAEALGRMVA